MGQLSWLFELPDNVRLGPKEGRHLLSRILNDTPNLASIFHYRNGAPICGANADVMATMRANLATPAERLQANNDAAYPTSRVYALGRVVSVIALNEDVAEAADAAAIPIARALTKEFGEAPRMRRIDSPCEAIESDRTWLYECRAFIPVAGLEETRSFLAKTPAEMLDVVRSKLWDGMERQARVMNLDLPDIREDLLSLEMDEPRSIVTVRRSGPTVDSSLPVDRGILVPVVRFTAHMQLSGHWAAGSFTSRGNGRIWYARHPGGSVRTQERNDG